MFWVVSTWERFLGGLSGRSKGLEVEVWHVEEEEKEVAKLRLLE